MNDPSLRARVSPHLSWAEATTTEHREYLEEQAHPPPHVRANLVRFAADVFESAWELVGALQKNSVYRCPSLNVAIGGSKTSAHMLGLAADVVPLECSLQDAYRRIAGSEIPIDQLILEYGRWLHLGAAPHGHEPRRQKLMIFTSGHYEPWSATDPRLRGVTQEETP